jgi:hypothetical protein
MEGAQIVVKTGAAPLAQNESNLCQPSFWLLRTFGEGGLKGLVIWAVMPLSQFRGYHSDHFFNSIR